MSTYGSGIVLNTKNGPSIYSITQAQDESSLPPTSHLVGIGADLDNQHGIDFAIGPISLTGYVNTTHLGVGIEIQLFGISLGTLYGNLKEGLVIKIDVIAAKGEVKLYLEDNAVWISITLKPLWGSDIDIDQKIFDL